MKAAMIDAGQVILSESVTTTEAGRDELEATVREEGRLVYKVAYSVLRNHHDAEDVAQETFLRNRGRETIEFPKLHHGD
jgi:hypothetical protein